MFDLNGALERFAGKLALENILAAAVTLLVCMVAVRLLLKLARRLLCRRRDQPGVVQADLLHRAGDPAGLNEIPDGTTLGRRRIVWKMSAAYDAPTETVKTACYRAVEATEHIRMAAPTFPPSSFTPEGP